jgi:hypothetical protein
MTTKSLLDEWLATGGEPDVWLFAALAMVVITCGLHDLEVCRRHVQAFLKFTPYSRMEFMVPLFILSRIEQLIEQGALMRAAELHYHYATYSPMVSGHRFPLGWAKRWPFMQRTDDQLKAELGADYPAAVERGAQLSEADLAQEVRIYLDEISG